MLRDLVEATREHPGVQHRLRRETDRFELDIDLTLDPDFEANLSGNENFCSRGAP